MKKIITKNAPLFATAVLALSTLFTASHADSTVKAGDQTNLNIKLAADIPSDEFQVLRQDNVNDGETKVLPYNKITKKLGEAVIPVNFKNTGGGTEAIISGHSSLYDSKTGARIPLLVQYIKKDKQKIILSESAPIKIHTGSVNDVQQESITINAKDPANPAPGSYQADLTIVFEVTT
ncbi:hypothetical protein [Candidatus Regiella endosymbiont of Tuberolachnus salignus]|uniref:hypothetical protein n=1 Tax=Candidatus Regiella endosymbiont of Tuberolachnus salignus TaxID=3077956 RepID=UPI0030D0B38B